MSWLSEILISPRTETGFRLRKGLLLGLLGVAFLLLYVIDYSFDNLQTDIPRLLLPLVALVMVDLLFLAEEPLQHPGSGSSRHASFFQSQFPRIYIQQRYNLPATEARQRWLSVFRQWKDEDHPNHFYYATSLRRRHECRAVYYLQWLSIRIFLLSVLALAVLACLTWWGELGLPPSYSLQNPGLTAARIAFPLFLLGLYLYVRVSNMPDRDNPTGAWLRWKEINDVLKAWWDRNEGAGMKRY